MPDFWGKYRGMVVDNVDPLTLGRLQVMVPRVLGDVLGAWAMPCVPYAGPDVGFCMAPPIGAAIWVEFEGGDPDYPVWTGCYWREGERPVTAELPTTRTILTACGILQFDDLPGEGGFTLSVGDPAVAMPVSIVAGSTGLTIRMAEVSIVLNETGVDDRRRPGAAVGTGGRRDAGAWRRDDRRDRTRSVDQRGRAQYRVTALAGRRGRAPVRAMR